MIDPNHPKVIGVILAYKHARFLENLYRSLPMEVLDSVIVTNDDSGDGIEQVAAHLSIPCFSHPRMGYGGNLKYGMRKALEMGADYIVDIHGDGQYGVEAIVPALNKIKEGYDMVMGSRFLDIWQPLRDDKMPLPRYLGTIVLSFIDRLVLGLPLTEFHNGFRIYSRHLLETVDLDATSNDFLFGGEIIAQAAYHKLKVGEVPVSCHYDQDHTSISYKRAIIYTLQMFGVLGKFILARLGSKIPLFDHPKSVEASALSRHSREDCFGVPERLEYKVMKEISACEVCGNQRLIPVLNLGSHPLCGDLIPIGSLEVGQEYPIEILFCECCFTAHQRYQIEKEKLFPKNYQYRAHVTGSVLAGMSGLVDKCEAAYGSLKDKLILDIGCNDGSLLDFFGARGARTLGIEPTDSAKESKHPTLQVFFDAEVAKQILANYGHPDFITFTNVFAHIDDLPALLNALKILIGENTVVVIENHYLGSVLEKNQFDTFYHEHPRNYSIRSFEFISRSLGLNLMQVEFPSRYGGNIRVHLGHGDRCIIPAIDESKFVDEFSDMIKHIAVWRVKTRRVIDEHVAKFGKFKAKAFPGRAAILIRLLGINEEQISAVYEIKGSFKVGHYVPGTRIPILPEAELFAGDLTQPILNLAWHLPDEVRANLASHGYTGEVIDINQMPVLAEKR